jgi:hypothetical protein
MISLALADFRADLSTQGLEALQTEFAEFHTLHLRGFLHEELLRLIREKIRDEDFVPRPHGKIAMELAVDSKVNLGVHVLQLRMNDQGLANFMETVTGVAPLRHFEGRVYRMGPSGDHYDSWHDDVTESRRIGVSINLSPAPYRGGTFIIKHHPSGQIIRPLPNLGPGDAIFFRVHPTLKHMVGRVEGDRSKTAFAGWFYDSRTLGDFLRDPQPEDPDHVPS